MNFNLLKEDHLPRAQSAYSVFDILPYLIYKYFILSYTVSSESDFSPVDSNKILSVITPHQCMCRRSDIANLLLSLCQTMCAYMDKMKIRIFIRCVVIDNAGFVSTSQ